MVLSYLEFYQLLTLVSYVILRAFYYLDTTYLFEYPSGGSVSLLDVFLGFTILALVSDFFYHVVHVGNLGSSSSESHDVEPDDVEFVPLSEYVDSLED